MHDTAQMEVLFHFFIRLKVIIKEISRQGDVLIAYGNVFFYS